MGRVTQPARARIDARLRNWGSKRELGQDLADAARVELAWRQLVPLHRELLRMVYVWGANREVICRRLKVPRLPTTILELELAAAQRAIEKILNE
jgi:hypothetical protein